jgi:hypothetical protein
VGTWLGLARFHQGQWRVFTKENSGLPSNYISSPGAKPEMAPCGWAPIAAWPAIPRPGQVGSFHQGQQRGLPGNDSSLAATPTAPSGWGPVAIEENKFSNYRYAASTGKWQCFILGLGFYYLIKSRRSPAGRHLVWAWGSWAAWRYQEGRWQNLPSVVGSVSDDKER